MHTHLDMGASLWPQQVRPLFVSPCGSQKAGTTIPLTLSRRICVYPTTSGLAVVQHMVHGIDWFSNCTQHWPWRRAWANPGHLDLQS